MRSTIRTQVTLILIMRTLKIKFTIDFESDGKIDKIERGKGMPNSAEKLILSELDHIQSEIKHNVPEPSINLQWLWNMKFEKRYSNQY